MSLPALGNGIVFRYLPGRPDLSSPVMVQQAEAGPILELAELPARGPGGWGLLPPYSAEFEAPHAAIRSVDSIAFDQVLGPEFSVEVWFSLSASLDKVILLDNAAVGEEGFVLSLQNGKPHFLLTLNGASYELPGTERLALAAHHWLAATVKQTEQALALRLYHNSRLIAEKELPVNREGRYTLRGPFFIGAARSSAELQGTFSGHLFAAVVKRYVVNPDYVMTPASDDGSGYFGLPMYHEYPLAGFQLPMDLRLSRSLTPLKYQVFAPYTNDFYILQGIATRYDTEKCIYMSAYHRLRDGATGTQESIVAELDFERQLQVRRCFRLQGALRTSHAGGIAFSQGAIYVASRSMLERYPLPEETGSARYLDLYPDAQGSINVRSKASFVSAEGDILWVGDYRTDGEPAPFLYGYRLGDDGRPLVGQEPAVYALPRRVQGVDFFTYKNRRFCFLSVTGGGETQIIRIAAEKLHPTRVPVADTIFVLPAGGEDLSFFPDGTLWSGSESGADYYQKGSSPWSTFFPFIYGLGAEVLFGDLENTTGVQEREPNPPHDQGAALELRTYPNPSNHEIKISFSLPDRLQVRLAVYDQIGREVAELVRGEITAGEHSYLWAAGRVASGTYFVALQTAIGNQVAVAAVLK